MSNSLINHISDTALWVAHFRAVESERKDAIFNDPFARRLAGDRGKLISKKMPGAVVVKWIMSVRTSAIDRLILKAIEAGVDTVINLGAGLDTRPYRMNLPSNLKWIEVDFRTTFDYKKEKLKNEKAACELRQIAVDLSNEKERRTLFENLNKETHMALVITEGLTIYLSNEENEKLSKDLFSQSHFSFWLMDYYQGQVRKLGMLRLQKALKNSPFKFSIPDKILFFQNHGWKIFDQVVLADESEKVHRYPPFAMALKILFVFLPDRTQKEIRESCGVVLFRR